VLIDQAFGILYPGNPVFDALLQLIAVGSPP